MLNIESKNFIVIAGATVAAVAGVYIVWGPSQSRRPRKKKGAICPGLVNLGNSCFLNSILQGLAPCPSVVQWLADFLQSKHAVHGSKYLAESLYTVLQALNNESVEFGAGAVVSAAPVLAALSVQRWHISPEQQDAHELFHVVTSTLGEEAAGPPEAGLALVPTMEQEEEHSQVDDPQREAVSGGVCASGARLQPLLPRTHRAAPFSGTLASCLQCQRCGHKNPTRYDSFDSLSLPIPANGGVRELSVDSLLAHFLQPETVHGVECEGCARLQQRGDPNVERGSAPAPRSSFVRKTRVCRLPRCLCVHVQRTLWVDGAGAVKRRDQVNIPEVLHMGQYRFRHVAAPRPDRLDLESGSLGLHHSGLLGGRARVNGYTKIPVRRPGSAVSPGGAAVAPPYPGPVNLLKALHFHTRATSSGLSLQPTANSTTSTASASLPAPSAAPLVRRLARAYTAEAVPSAAGGAAYRLTAVLVHLGGDVFQGHFITYRRAPSTNGQRFPDRWLLTSDMDVQSVGDLDQVLRGASTAGAYMLFYQRI